LHLKLQVQFCLKWNILNFISTPHYYQHRIWVFSPCCYKIIFQNSDQQFPKASYLKYETLYNRSQISYYNVKSIYISSVFWDIILCSHVTVNFYWSIQCDIPEDRTLHSHHYEELRSKIKPCL
jgi:hypothetical protein